MKSLNLSKPHLIVVVGIPGSGKSSFAEHFADTFKSPIVSCDRLRDGLFKSADYNKNTEKNISYVASDILDEVLKTDRTTVYDGHIYSRADRDQIARRSRNFGYETLFVWVQTDAETAKMRATKPGSNKFTISPEMFDTKLNRFNAPHRTENFIVISGKHTYSSQLKIVLKYLAGPRWQVPRQTGLTLPSRVIK